MRMTTYIQTTAIQGSFTIVTLWILCENDNIHPNYSYTRLLHYCYFKNSLWEWQHTSKLQLYKVPSLFLLYEFFVRMTTYIQTTAIQGSFTILTLWILCENDNIHPNYSYTRLLHYRYFMNSLWEWQHTSKLQLYKAPSLSLLYEFFVRMTTYIQTSAIQGSFTILTLWILCENDNIHPNYSYTRLLHYSYFMNSLWEWQHTSKLQLYKAPSLLLLYEFFVRMTTYIQTTAIQGSFTIVTLWILCENDNIHPNYSYTRLLHYRCFMNSLWEWQHTSKLQLYKAPSLFLLYEFFVRMTTYIQTTAIQGSFTIVALWILCENDNIHPNYSYTRLLHYCYFMNSLWEWQHTSKLQLYKAPSLSLLYEFFVRMTTYIQTTAIQGSFTILTLWILCENDNIHPNYSYTRLLHYSYFMNSLWEWQHTSKLQLYKAPSLLLLYEFFVRMTTYIQTTAIQGSFTIVTLWILCENDNIHPNYSYTRLLHYCYFMNSLWEWQHTSKLQLYKAPSLFLLYEFFVRMTTYIQTTAIQGSFTIVTLWILCENDNIHPNYSYTRLLHYSYFMNSLWEWQHTSKLQLYKVASLALLYEFSYWFLLCHFLYFFSFSTFIYAC